MSRLDDGQQNPPHTHCYRRIGNVEELPPVNQALEDRPRDGWNADKIEIQRVTASGGRKMRILLMATLMKEAMVVLLVTTLLPRMETIERVQKLGVTRLRRMDGFARAQMNKAAIQQAMRMSKGAFWGDKNYFGKEGGREEICGVACGLMWRSSSRGGTAVRISVDWGCCFWRARMGWMGWARRAKRRATVVEEEQEEGRKGCGSWTWRELTEHWSRHSYTAERSRGTTTDARGDQGLRVKPMCGKDEEDEGDEGDGDEDEDHEQG